MRRQIWTGRRFFGIHRLEMEAGLGQERPRWRLVRRLWSQPPMCRGFKVIAKERQVDLLRLTVSPPVVS